MVGQRALVVADGGVGAVHQQQLHQVQLASHAQHSMPRQRPRRHDSSQVPRPSGLCRPAALLAAPLGLLACSLPWLTWLKKAASCSGVQPSELRWSLSAPASSSTLAACTAPDTQAGRHPRVRRYKSAQPACLPAFCLLLPAYLLKTAAADLSQRALCGRPQEWRVPSCLVVGDVVDVRAPPDEQADHRQEAAVARLLPHPDTHTTRPHSISLCSP